MQHPKKQQNLFLMILNKNIELNFLLAIVYFILKGKGVMHINDESKEVGKDCVVYIPTRSVQFIKNTGGRELEFLCIVTPPWYSRDEEII